MLLALTGWFDKAPIGVLVLDEEGVIVYVNRRQCEQSKLEPRAFLGKHHRSAAHETLERAGILPMYDRLLRDGTPFELTLPRYRRHLDGAMISLTMRGFRHEGLTFLLTSVDQALSIQLDRYEQLFENANDAIFVVSKEGKFTEVNPKMCQIIGFPREELLGRTTESFLPGRGAQSMQRIQRILREGRLGPYELEITTPRGTRFVSLNGFALVEEGQSVAVMNIARDVTAEHKRREELEALNQGLRESEKKFRCMIQGTPDPVALTDFATGQILEVNDAWCAFSGMGRMQLLDGEVRIMNFWPDRGERREFARALRREGFARDCEATLRVRNEERLGSISGALLEIDGTKAVVTWLRDVTEHRRMETALRESEERFRQLATAAPVGIFRTDGSGRCTYTNSRWQQIAGLTLEESLGEGWRAAIHPEDLERVSTAWRSVVAEHSQYEDEFRFRAPAGRVCWARVRAAPIRSDSGAVLGFVGTAEDVSGRRAAEQMRRDVARMLSHDIKNPLAVIRGFVDLLREDLKAGRYADIPSFLDAVEGATEQAMSLALNFLDSERIEADQLALRKAPSSLNEIIDEVLHRQAALARVKNVTLRADLERRPSILSVDRGLIERALANLVSNALKYSPEGAVVVVSSRSTEGAVNVSVRDEGRGVAPEVLPRLFQRFSATDRGGADSTGLGLFVVRTIVEGHGGSIAVESAPGKGACFTVTLPKPPQDEAHGREDAASTCEAQRLSSPLG